MPNGPWRSWAPGAALISPLTAQFTAPGEQRIVPPGRPPAHVSHTWDHGLGEIVMALMDAGLRLTALTEHDSVPWEAFPGKMEQIGNGEWRLADQPWRLPHTYTLQAVKHT